MTTIESVVQTVNRELAPRFEERLRHHLAGRDKEWLIEQIVRLSLGAHGQQATDQGNPREAEERAERVSRLRDIALDLEGLREFSERYATCTRERLIDEVPVNYAAHVVLDVARHADQNAALQE